MQYVIEQPKSYSDLDNLRHDLSAMNVRETGVFSLEQMRITNQGTIQVQGIGEFLLTEIALRDALRRGGMHLHTGENYFGEEKEVLDKAIVNAVNVFYKYSKYADSQVKLITRDGDNDEKVVLGITSSRYVLLSHEMAVEKILPSLPSRLTLSRCNVYPEFLDMAFTDKVNTAKDAVGEVIETGLCFMNSQGTKTRSLISSAFAIRLVCKNGSTATDCLWSVKYPHRGNILNSNGELGRKMSEILQNFSAMMCDLPRLGTIPVTDKLLSRIQSDLNEALGVKGSNRFLEGVNRERETVMGLWNKITNLPHHLKQAEKKLKMEQLGFRILTMFLHQNN